MNQTLLTNNKLTFISDKNLLIDPRIKSCITRALPVDPVNRRHVEDHVTTQRKAATPASSQRVTMETGGDLIFQQAGCYGNL